MFDDLVLPKKDIPIDGYVYVIHRIDRPEYKIGISENVGRRLSELSRGGHKLELVHQIPAFDSSHLEENLHMTFDAQKIKGEWFRLSERDLWALKQATDPFYALFQFVMAYHYGKTGYDTADS